MPSGVHAQTPTPHPNALNIGMYQFEDLSSPEIELTGTDWTIQSYRGSTVLGNSTDTETLTFWVTELADYLTIYRVTTNVELTAGEWSVCVDAICQSTEDYSGEGIEAYAVDLFETNSQVVITKEDDEATLFDFMTIALAPSSLTSSEETPEPYYIFESVSGTDGNIETRFDMIVTVGDVAVSSALLFLFFSLWAFILLVIIPKRENHVGK